MGLRVLGRGSSAGRPMGTRTEGMKPWGMRPVAKPLLRCCEAKVLGGDGDVHVGVVVSVALSRPSLLFVLQAHYDDGGLLYPLPTITGLDLRQHGLLVDEQESPGLAVDGRRCQPHALLDVVQLLLRYGFILILAAALSRQT